MGRVQQLTTPCLCRFTSARALTSRLTSASFPLPAASYTCQGSGGVNSSSSSSIAQLRAKRSSDPGGYRGVRERERVRVCVLEGWAGWGKPPPSYQRELPLLTTDY